MANAIVFNDKDRSAEITAAELAQTMEVGGFAGQAFAQCPMQPGELIESVCGLIRRVTGLEPIQKPIVIREPYVLTDRKKAKSGEPLELQDYMIRRMVTCVQLPINAFEGDIKQMSPGFAITYSNTDSQKGMQLAFGENVHVCENLNAYGRFHFSTFGSEKVGFDEGMQMLNHWVRHLTPIHDAHVQLVRDLESISVGRDRFHQIIGHLFERAVRANHNSKQVYAPLNQTQVGQMVAAGYDMLEQKDTFTAWEIMNWGTDIIKPHGSDLIGMLETSTQFNDFILEEFGTQLVLPDLGL